MGGGELTTYNTTYSPITCHMMATVALLFKGSAEQSQALAV